MSKRKTKASADPMAELLADAERLAKAELAGRPDTKPITALEALPADEIKDGAPAKLQIVKQGNTVQSALAPGSGWPHKTFGLAAEHDAAATMLLAQLSMAMAGSLNGEMVVNGALSAIHAEAPKSPVEALLLVQMMQAAHLSASCAESAGRATNAQHKADNARISLQGSSVVCKLTDCLQRLRGKPSSTQRVIVENVTAESGSQVVVGAISGGSDGK